MSHFNSDGFLTNTLAPFQTDRVRAACCVRGRLRSACCGSRRTPAHSPSRRAGRRPRRGGDGQRRATTAGGQPAGSLLAAAAGGARVSRAPRPRGTMRTTRTTSSCLRLLTASSSSASTRCSPRSSSAGGGCTACWCRRGRVRGIVRGVCTAYARRMHGVCTAYVCHDHSMPITRMDTVHWQDSMELKKRKDGAAVALVQKLAEQHWSYSPPRKPRRSSGALGPGGCNSGGPALAQLATCPAAQLAAWQRHSWAPAAGGAP